jgi:isoleucyl-tRNA synthetase
LQVFEANDKIIQDLKNRGLVVKVESITHSYPHCRRCDTPLIYRAIDSRFIAVNKKEYNFKEKLLKEAEEIYFVPEAVKNRFKK